MRKEVKEASCLKEGCLTWKEFLDFFFLKDVPLAERINKTSFYDHLDMDGNLIKEETKKKKRGLDPDSEEGDQDDLALNESTLRKRQQKLLSEV